MRENRSPLGGILATRSSSLMASWPALRLPAAMGLAATLSLLLFYAAFAALASSSIAHALDLLGQDRFFVATLALGFGTQVGLFVYVRRRLRSAREAGVSTAVAASGTGASSASMVACCLHHLSDVLPLLGLSGAAVFLGEYRTEFMALGIVANALGIAMMVRLLRRARPTLRCHMEGGR